MIEPSSDGICNWAWLNISGHHSLFFQILVEYLQVNNMDWAGAQLGVLRRIWLFVLIWDEYIY